MPSGKALAQQLLHLSSVSKRLGLYGTTRIFLCAALPHTYPSPDLCCIYVYAVKLSQSCSFKMSSWKLSNCSGSCIKVGFYHYPFKQPLNLLLRTPLYRCLQCHRSYPFVLSLPTTLSSHYIYNRGTKVCPHHPYSHNT